MTRLPQLASALTRPPPQTRGPGDWFSTPTIPTTSPDPTNPIWDLQGGAGGLNQALRNPLAGPDIEVWTEVTGLSGGYIRLVARWDQNYLRFQFGSEPELPDVGGGRRPRAMTTDWTLTKGDVTLAQGDVPYVEHDRVALRIESGLIRCNVESYGIVWEGTSDIPSGAGKVGFQTSGVSLIAFGAGTL